MIVQTYNAIFKKINNEYLVTSWSDVVLVCSGKKVNNVTYDKIIVVVKNIPYHNVL